MQVQPAAGRHSPARIHTDSSLNGLGQNAPGRLYVSFACPSSGWANRNR